MTQVINQFELGKDKGQLDMGRNNNVIQAKVYSSNSTALVPGQLVKIIDTATSIPEVDAAADTSDVPFGFVIMNHKRNSYAADAAIEIAMTDSVMFMIASAAIAKGAEVMYVAASGKVATATGTTKYICGSALDKAAADGDIVRVWIKAWPHIKQPAS